MSRMAGTEECVSGVDDQVVHGVIIAFYLPRVNHLGVQDLEIPAQKYEI